MQSLTDVVENQERQSGSDVTFSIMDYIYSHHVTSSEVNLNLLQSALHPILVFVLQIACS